MTKTELAKTLKQLLELYAICSKNSFSKVAGYNINTQNPFYFNILATIRNCNLKIMQFTIKKYETDKSDKRHKRLVH